VKAVCSEKRLLRGGERPLNSRPAVAFPAALAMRLPCMFPLPWDSLLARPRPCHSVGVRPEQAVGRARMEVDVAVEAGAEKIGDGSEFRLVSRGSVEAFEPSHVREILRPSGGSLVGKQMAF
jgi:hypothetical protein